MFYNQNVSQIKLLILSLDGGLLDLNRLRYNYFNHTCNQYDKHISKEEFSSTLGNMNTMYRCSPIQDVVSNQELNRLIERDLFEYSKIKQNIKKDGVDELLQFARQRNIKVAVISTHKSKRAIQYMQLTGIYKHVDFFIGGDSQCQPLPSHEPLEMICQQMNIAPENALVVANFEALVEAAQHLYMNIIYMSDLVEPTQFIEASVFKVARNNLEIINIFLFSKYDNVEIFSPMLGMSDKMSLQVLKTTYHQLLDKYQDDEQLVDLVNRTYEYFFHRIQGERKQPHIEIQKFNDQIQKTQKPIIQDKPVQIVKEAPKPIVEDVPKPVFEEAAKPKIDDVPIEKIEKQTSLNHDEVVNSYTSAISLDAKRMNELMDIINGDQSEVQDATKEVTTPIQEKKEPVSLKQNKKQEVHQDEDSEDIDDTSFIAHLVTFVYTVLSATLIVLIALIVFIAFRDFFTSTSGLGGLCHSAIDGYTFFLETTLGLICDGCHSLISTIPSYKTLMSGVGFLSPLAILSIYAVVLNVIVIYLGRFIYHFVDDRFEDDGYDE